MSLSGGSTAILLSFYMRGMTSKRSDLIKEAALASGLSETTVKNWVGNKSRNRRPKRLKGGMNLTGYNLFCRDHMKEGDIRQAGAAWQALPPEEKTAWSSRAREGNVGGGNEETKLLRRKRLIKQLKDQVKVLEDEGMDVGIMLNDPSTKTTEMVCTNSVVSFMEQTMPGFTQYLFAGEKQKPTAAVVKSDLTKKVQALFNKKYEEAGGKGPFPYDAVKKNKKNIIVTGLPYTFKRPSAYGTTQLRNILENNDTIAFLLEENPPEEDGENVMEQDIDQDIDQGPGILDLSMPQQTDDLPWTSSDTHPMGLWGSAAQEPLLPCSSSTNPPMGMWGSTRPVTMTPQETLPCNTIDMEMWQDVATAMRE